MLLMVHFLPHPHTLLTYRNVLLNTRGAMAPKKAAKPKPKASTKAPKGFQQYRKRRCLVQRGIPLCNCALPALQQTASQAPESFTPLSATVTMEAPRCPP